MTRRTPRPHPRPQAEAEPAPAVSATEAASPSFWTPLRLALAVGTLLAVHWTLAVRSLVRENPTVDEVAHLPAGITYWQTGSFRLYPHNPPLVKLAAALPVLRAEPVTEPLYRNLSWTRTPPVHASFAHEFAVLNAPQYFELFQRGRLVMPWFSVLGGLAVFAWSRRLYGAGGGLLSLALWAFCPNILAHARLVTTDVGATALGVGATYLFWRYLHRPSWARAARRGDRPGAGGADASSARCCSTASGPCCGWSMSWPVTRRPADRRRTPASVRAQGAADRPRQRAGDQPRLWLRGDGAAAGPLRVLERVAHEAAGPRPGSGPPRATTLLEFVRPFRVNRFRDSALERLPVPLPRYYLLGFDLQKLEAEGCRCASSTRTPPPTHGPATRSTSTASCAAAAGGITTCWPWRTRSPRGRGSSACSPWPCWRSPRVRGHPGPMRSPSRRCRSWSWRR